MTFMKGLLKKLGVVILLLMVFASCRDRMEGLNRNLKGVTSQDLKIDAAAGKVLLPSMELHIKAVDPVPYQLQENLGADIYSGYMMTPTPFGGNINNVTYSLVDNWVDQIWNTPRKTLNAWLTFKKKGLNKEYPDLYGIALICKVFAASRAADAFGPIPYTQYGKTSSPPFDGLKKVYYAFFDDLTKAVKLLTNAEDKNPTADQARFKSVDKSLFGGDYALWIKAANTLRLRLAIRISLVDPDKAEKEAEAAVHQKYGLLERGDPSFAMKPTGNNPMYTIVNAWGDLRTGAPLTTILKGYHDPRLEKYVLPAEDPQLNGMRKGIRAGIKLPAKQVYEGYSKLNVQAGDPLKLIDASESYFLRAEGALRGWNMGGSAGHFYKQGVITSFLENGLSKSAAMKYLSNDTYTQIPYVDPKNPANNAPALNKVTVKWDPTASFQVKLQKIIIQKWIAIFPEGYEAWAEFRRTGYPKLYPNKINHSKHISDGEFIKRFTYSSTFTNTSGAQVQKAVNKYLDGHDWASEPLWWDVKGTGHCPGCRQ